MLCWLIVAVIVGCSTKTKEPESLPFYNTPEFTAEWIAATEPGYKAIHTIDTFSFHNQLGQIINSDSLKGKIYAANFFFTSCPSICPKMTSNLNKVQETFIDDKEIMLVSFSVMPWKDSISRLNSYAEEKGVLASKWHLLTGNKNRIYTLARKSYFAEKGLGRLKDTSEFLHTETVVLIDKKARIRGIYNATQKTDVERLIEDMLVLKEEEF